MDVRTVNAVNKAIHNVLDNLETEMCVLHSKFESEYEAYFNSIRSAIVASADQFHRDYIHNATVQKNILK